MKQSHTSRNYAKAFFAFVTIGLAGACADTTVAPTTAEVAAFKAPAEFNKRDGVKTFRLDNRGSVQRIGEHVLSVPAGAICALNSSYGPTEWDKPCTPMSGSVTITATMLRNAQNQPYVDFQPALRFNPESRPVMLFLRNGLSTHATWLGIDYCTNEGVCMDESIDDPSLKPFRVGLTSMIGRRIKHFSGYVVTVGEPCNGTLTQEPDGTWMCNDEGLFRRSGYMVASGLDAEKPSDRDGEKVDEKSDKKGDSQ